MIQQMSFFKYDLLRMIGKKKLRLLFIWMSRAFWGVFLYRFERGLFLTFGRGYEIFRIILLPLLNLIEAYSNIDIPFKANIGPGLLILHPAAGIVVSGHANVGANLTLTGGNIIGVQGKCEKNQFNIGSHCKLGANAVIIGPLSLANYINIGASACVIHDCLEERCSLVGVPAKMIKVYN